MSDVISLGNKITTLNASSRYNSFACVRIYIDDKTYYEAGNNTGRTLEIDNPFGTQQMADNLLAIMSGQAGEANEGIAYRYQPYTANGALLNPAAEIGDFINAKGVYGCIFNRKVTFGRLQKADLESPTDEEINHEYKFETPAERKYKRVTAEMRTSIAVNAQEIALEASARKTADSEMDSKFSVKAEEISASVEQRVPQSGGSNTSDSFSWSLTATGHNWYANGSSTPVMSITATGLSVKGQITATSGTIGGFTIGSNKLQYNNLNWGDTDKSTGVYIGTSGIQLGKNFSVNNQGKVTASNLIINGGSISIGDNFSVNSNGVVTATGMKLKGTLYFWSEADQTYYSLSAADLRKGAQAGYNWQYGSYSGTTPYQYALGGAGGGFKYDAALNGNNSSTYTCKTLNNTSSYMRMAGSYVYLQNIVINGTTYRIMAAG